MTTTIGLKCHAILGFIVMIVNMSVIYLLLKLLWLHGKTVDF